MSELIYYRNLEEQLLVFPVLGNSTGIELKYVNSISLISDLIPIPRSPDYILGIVNIDSNIYPVIDLDVLLSGNPPTTTKSRIISLIDIKSNIFGIHTHQLPNVIPGAVGDAKGKNPSIPKKWIIGYTEHAELGKIPIIDPKKFWVGMGESEVVGPALDSEINAAQLIEEEADETNEPEAKLDEQEVVAETTEEDPEEEAE